MTTSSSVDWQVLSRSPLSTDWLCFWCRRGNCATFWYCVAPLKAIITSLRYGSGILWRVCLCVCLSVRADISRITWPIFANFFVHAASRRGSVSHGCIAIRYVLPVLCTTLRFPINGPHYVFQHQGGVFDVHDYLILYRKYSSNHTGTA